MAAAIRFTIYNAILLAALVGCGQDCHTSGNANCPLPGATATQLGNTQSSCVLSCSDGVKPFLNSSTNQYACNAGATLTKKCTQATSTNTTSTDGRSQL
jgi:hypothetical protein